jgi:Ca2+-transporting ATPase
MGVAGTEVSKEAADMILADDDFATIVAAVEEGRRIYDNIRRFLRYILTTHSGELWLWMLVLTLSLPIPLLPLQILWVNLLTDGVPSIALGVEPAERDAMRRPPRPRSEPIWGHGLWQQAVWVGLLMGVTCGAVMIGARAAGLPWQTMVFTTLALLQLGNALSVRSETESAFSLGIRTNPWIVVAVAAAAASQLAVVYVPALQEVFSTEPLAPAELGIVVLASSSAFVAVEVEKLIRRRRVHRHASIRSEVDI